MKSIIFTFTDKHYLQLFGTAMGTQMAPSFACLFMTKLEQQVIDSTPVVHGSGGATETIFFFVWTREEDSL